MYLALSAPFVSRVLISNSWPYLAAIWRGVFPNISTQSISPPEYRGRRKHDVVKCFSWGHTVIFNWYASQRIWWGNGLKCFKINHVQHEDAVDNVRLCYHFGSESGSLWSARALQPYAKGSSLLYSVKQRKFTYLISVHRTLHPTDDCNPVIYSYVFLLFILSKSA